MFVIIKHNDTLHITRLIIKGVRPASGVNHVSRYLALPYQDTKEQVPSRLVS